MRFFARASGIFTSLLVVQLAQALPASARLFQATYGYKTSCLLCHSDGGGSAPNAYGKAFLRAGANLGAFKRIDTKDSDEDGIPNLKEILARSNPGRKESTPTAPGDWLANAGALFIPEKELKELFADAAKFSAIEGSLNAAQVAMLKNKTGSDPIDDDKVPTFYFAEKDGKKVAVAQLITSKVGDNSLTCGVAAGTNGKVKSTEIFKISKGLPDPASFAASLKDKDLVAVSAMTPSNDSEKLILDATKRSLALMNIVFGGGK